MRHKLRETPGSIGYLDAGHGRNQAGLGEVSIRNAAGSLVVSSDLAASKGLELVAEYAVKKQIFNADYTDDWSAVALLNLGSVVVTHVCLSTQSHPGRQAGMALGPKMRQTNAPNQTHVRISTPRQTDRHTFMGGFVSCVQRQRRWL